MTEAKKATAAKTTKPKAAKIAKKAAAEAVPRLRIRVRAYENKILDASVKQIIDTALRYDVEVLGPVPLLQRSRNIPLIALHSCTKMRESNLRCACTSDLSIY
jgi:ribosomal protein S10